MNSLAVAALLFGSMLLMMALRIPIAAAMFVPGAIAYWAMTGDAALLGQLKQMTWSRFSNYDLSVIPMFLLMGQFATQGGLSRALFQAARAFVGHLRGGLAMATVLACAGFGAICGSSFATAATVTQVALPEMRRYAYSPRLSTGSLAAGGTLGISIPPSVPLIIYAILTEQNIARIFAAAMIPGLVAAGGYLVAIAIYARMRPEQAPALERLPLPQRLATLKEVWSVVAIFLLVFGGIYGGLFTPTEGAAVGAASTFALAAWRGELTLQGLRFAFVSTAGTTAMLFMIFLGADMMSVALAVSQAPAELARAVAASGMPPLLVLALILLLYVVLGCVMDEMAMILLTLPILFPVVMGMDFFGLSPEHKAIWFGILILVVIQMGMVIPPVGLNVYVINSLARDVPLIETYRGVMPFVASDVIRMCLLIAFPPLSLYVLRWMT